MNCAVMVSHLDSWGQSQEKVLRFAFLHSYFKIEQKYPLDDAILAYVYTNTYKFQPSKWRKVDEIPFDFIRRRVTVVLETGSHDDNRAKVMITKGAIEEVMKVCSFVDHVTGNEIRPFTEEDRQRILNVVDEISNDGLRVIGISIKDLHKV